LFVSESFVSESLFRFRKFTFTVSTLVSGLLYHLNFYSYCSSG